MINSNKSQTSLNFKPTINHNSIEKTNKVKYLGAQLDDKLSWARLRHIDNTCKKLSKVCGMIYKLKHYVFLLTLKLV